MYLFELAELDNIRIKYTHKCGMGHFCDFEYDLILYSGNNKNCGIELYPNDDYHTEIEDIYYHRFYDVDFNYFRSIYERLKKIDYRIFLEHIELYDASYIYFEISKNNYFFKIKYFPFFIFEPRSNKYYQNKDLVEINKIFDELKQKINHEKWYNEIRSKIHTKNILERIPKIDEKSIIRKEI